MSNKSVKLGKEVTLNKDAVTKLQEDQLNKLKGGKKVGDMDQDLEGSFSCFHITCNYCE
ncbi:class I lanthipeptide [Chryseobacterium sp. G0186]|uniref:class I lanthipeptide n=1 Tax=Chryseobacterium sp. G0186 TaxID=2487064 RepID=UPI0013DDBB32|nr:class I lanthipeptide [Chryseobacterium sp. G0186]